MGDSKVLSELGPTRKLHVYDAELLDFVTVLVARNAQGQVQRTTRDFDDRKRTKRMLKQLGAYDIFIKMTDKTGGGLPVTDIKKEPRVVEMTVESIDYFLGQIKEVPLEQAMRVCELEERLTDAKAGLYVLPEELQPKAVEPEAEASFPG